MAQSNASELGRQLARARRRLVLGTLLAALAWSWVVALVLSVGWFVAQPYLFGGAPLWVRWAVVGGLTGAASLVALVVALLRAPTPVAVALSLDERFGLKERVTTSLMLRPEQAATPVGQALVADANARVAPLRVGDRFPVRLPWKPGALATLGALALVLLALLWQPRPAGTTASAADDTALSATTKAELEKKLNQIVKRTARKPTDPPPPKDLESIQAKVEELVRRPYKTEDDLRKGIKDATSLEDELRKRQKAEADRDDALKEQMKQQAERLRKKKKDKEGPAEDFSKALSEADFKKAQDEAERLSRKLAEEAERDRLRKKLKDDKEKLTPEQRKQAEDDLERLERERKKQEEEQDRLRKKLKDKDKELTPEERKQAEDDLERLEREQKKQEEEQDRLRKKLKDDDKKEKLDREQRKAAEDKLEKLEKKKDELTPKDKEDLKEQLKDAQDQLERLTRDKEEQKKDLEDKQKKLDEEQKKLEDKQKELEKKKQEEGADKEQLDREQQKLQQEKQKLQEEKDKLEQEKQQAEKQGEKGGGADEQDKKDLKEAAKKLAESREALAKGKNEEAAQKLAEAGKQLGKLDRENQSRELQREMQKAQQVRRSLARALSNRGGPGAGKRPEGDGGKTGEEDVRVGGEVDKGRLEVIGTGPPGGFKGPRAPSEMREEIRRAAQEAPAAIDRQRLPPAAKKMARGFFEKVRGPDKEKEKK
jgi:hypothetical protein